MTGTLDRVKTYQQFIGGDWVDSAGGQTLEVENPANGQVIANVPASAHEDVDRAVDAAAKAFETWQHTTPQDRSLMLLKLADALEARADELGRLEIQERGQAGRRRDRRDPRRRRQPAASSPARRGSWRARPPTSTWPATPRIIRREPVGVVASIAPWNYPIMMAGWKIGPALAAGNTVVLKPSARTPLTALVLAEIARRHLPARRRSTC